MLDELINEILQGKSDSYKKLIEQITPILISIARIHLTNEEDVEDAIQETILLVHKKIYQLKDTKLFKTWVIRILINECNSIHRKNQRQERIFNKIISLKYFRTSTNEIDKVNSKLNFLSMLNCLNTNEKVDIVLFYRYNYSIEEIANIQNESANTIKSRIFRAKQKIKNNEREGLKNE